ncbi:MAG: hypothetical protein AAFZ15_18980 [Bacteroidota bacterium]
MTLFLCLKKIFETWKSNICQYKSVIFSVPYFCPSTYRFDKFSIFGKSIITNGTARTAAPFEKTIFLNSLIKAPLPTGQINLQQLLGLQPGWTGTGQPGQWLL